MSELEGEIHQVGEGRFEDVEWELCSSAREAAVLLLPFPARYPWTRHAESGLFPSRPLSGSERRAGS